PLDQVANLQSAAEVTLLTTGGERYRRRIQGLESGRLLLSDAAGGPGGPLDLGQLAAINPDETPVTWTGSLTVGGLYLTGNTERRAMQAGFDAERRTADDRITLRGRWDYAEEKIAPGLWNLSQRRTYGGMKYDYFLGKRWYVWGNTSGEGDTQANLDLRFTAGAGVGHQLVDTDTFQLSLEVGPSYLYENYRTATPSTESVTARGAYTLTWDITDTIRLQQFTEAFESLEDKDDLFIRKDTRLQTKLTDNMVGQLQWILLYDNTPAGGNDRLD